MSQPTAAQSLDNLSQRLIAEHWDFYPTAGRRIGRHEYDGRLPDLSPARVRRRLEELRRGLGQLFALSQQDLSSDQRLSYRLMELFLKRELFNLEDWRPLENNPMRQVGFLNVGGYVRRDYAPLADRLRSATQALGQLGQVPDFTEALDSSLEPELGRPVLEMSIESYSGMARFYRVDLGRAVADFTDSSVLEPFNQAREAAALAVERFVERLQFRLEQAREDFAIGAKLYAGMLATGEGITASLAELGALGQANLDANLEQLAAAVEAVKPGWSIRETVADIGRRHPSPEGLIPEPQDMLETIRRSLNQS